MKNVHLAAAVAVFAIAFAVYAMTLAPTVGLVDSGALTVAAWSLGNAHPPGFPLYLMLTKLVMLLPIGSVAWRANLASALFAALACAMTALTVAEILMTPSPAPRERDSRRRRQGEGLPPLVIAIVAAFAGLLLTFSRTLWAYATVAEVYALNTFLIVTIFWLMFRWRRTNEIKWLFLAAGVFGLALGVHHVTIGVMLAGITVLVVRTAGLKFFRTKSFAIAALIAIIAFVAVYSYLPIAAKRKPALNWGNPADFSRVVDHVTGKQYRSYISTSAQESQLDDITRLTTRELGPRALPLALLLALYGLVAAFKRDRSLFWLLALAFAACCAWMLVYPIVNDEDAYLLPAFVALILAAAFGAASIARERPTVAAMFLVLPIVAAIAHWPYRDRSAFRVSKEYVDNTLRGIEGDALLITNDWQLYGAMFYFQEAERARPDVKPIEYGMLIRSWYIGQLEHRHPELFGLVQKELAAYRPLLKISEDDRARWNADVTVQEQFNARLDDLVVALIAQQIARGGRAYATYEVAMSREPVDQNLVARLGAAYDVVPRGIAMELMPGHQPREPKITPIETASLTGSMRYEPDDVVLTEVLPAYRSVMLIRARWLAIMQRFDLAAAEYRRALDLEPDNAMILRELQTVEMRRGTS